MTEQERIYDIAPEIIEDSPTNPRQHYSNESIAELADSFAEVGVIEPLIVRPIGDGLKGNYECIVGHRRKRAAIKVGLPTVPCLIRDMTDEQVREMQHVENAQREDVHSMEEALSFEAMVLELGYTVEQLAAKIGKSVQYIHSRMRLLALTNQNRELFLNGRFELGHALVISQLHDEQDQDEAGRFAAYGHSGMHKKVSVSEKEIEREDDEPFEPSSLFSTRHQVESMMRNIESVPWDPADDNLLPAAGPCTTCPKMTGNEPQETLFDADVKTKGRCTDRACYSAKMDETWKRLHADHMKIGGTVLTKKAAKKAFGGANNLVYDAEYDDLMRSSWSHDGKPMFEVLEPDPKDIVLARDASGTIRYLIDSKKAKSMMRKRTSKSGDGTLTPKEKTDRLKRKRENETNRTIAGVVEICTRIALEDPTFREYIQQVKDRSLNDRLIATAVMLLDSDYMGRVAQSLDYAQEDYDPQRDNDAVIKAMHADMTSGKLDPVDVIMRYALRHYRGHQVISEPFEMAMNHLAVPLNEVMDKNLAELKSKWDEQDARRKKRESSKKKNGKKASSKKSSSKKKSKKNESDDTEPPTTGPEAA